jgi:hypothetical protein
MTEGRYVQRLFRVTPPLGARGPVSIWRRVLCPHSPFGLVARLSTTHKRAQTASGPPQSPTRSLEVSGFQTDPLTPWYNGPGSTRVGPGSTLSNIRRVSLEGKKCYGKRQVRRALPFLEIASPLSLLFFVNGVRAGFP